MRIDMWGDKKLTLCYKCMQDEEVGTTSRRHKSNQKSVIFTRSGFEDSIIQSPNYDYFLHSKKNQGASQTLPIDFHIDLGNYCNLACKMCHSQSSSRIAAQQVEWGNLEHKKYLGLDWTKNEKVWDSFLQQMLKMKLQNIHFMGGETILQKRFHDFLDFMIKNKKFDINFSFVSNGTKFDLALVEKLKLFQRVGIEISIETLTEHNSYIRQGTKTKEVLQNIEKYREHCNNERISVTIRPAPSALSIGTYYTLIEYCLEQKLIIKSNSVHKPSFLNISSLPVDIKKEYEKKYQALLIKHNLDSIRHESDFNESDEHNIKKIIKLAICQAIGLLNFPTPSNYEEELKKMVEHCTRWDKVYGYNALELFPEFKDIFLKNGYQEI
jgi:organic radical activating enzyme